MKDLIENVIVDVEGAVQENLDNMTKYVDGYAALAVASQSEADILNRMQAGPSAELIEIEADIYRQLSRTVEESQKTLQNTPFFESPAIAFELLEKETALLEKLVENRRKMMDLAKHLKVTMEKINGLDA
jgi:hypothetical protein